MEPTFLYNGVNSILLNWPLDYYLWVAVKDKCYADKPETIDALKANLHEAIGEIQLHTIGNSFFKKKSYLAHPVVIILELYKASGVTFREEINL